MSDLVASGSRAAAQEDAVRIELHSRKAKLLGRVELKGDKDRAVALQKQFKLTSLGKRAIQPAAKMPSFGNKELIGVELLARMRRYQLSRCCRPWAARHKGEVTW